MPYNRLRAIVGGKEKVVTSVDVYKEIRRLQLEGVTSQRAAAKRLGISRNTVHDSGGGSIHIVLSG